LVVQDFEGVFSPTYSYSNVSHYLAFFLTTFFFFLGVVFFFGLGFGLGGGIGGIMGGSGIIPGGIIPGIPMGIPGIPPGGIPGGKPIGIPGGIPGGGIIGGPISNYLSLSWLRQGLSFWASLLEIEGVSPSSSYPWAQVLRAYLLASLASLDYNQVDRGKATFSFSPSWGL